MSMPHYGKADNLGRSLEIAKGIFHTRTLRDAICRLKQFSSDNTTPRPGTRNVKISDLRSIVQPLWLRGNNLQPDCHYIIVFAD